MQPDDYQVKVHKELVMIMLIILIIIITKVSVQPNNNQKHVFWG